MNESEGGENGGERWLKGLKQGGAGEGRGRRWGGIAGVVQEDETERKGEGQGPGGNRE